MDGMNFFNATVKIEIVDNKGKLKNIKEKYLVSAVSPTDVESKLAKELAGEDYDIQSIVLTKYAKII